MSLGSKGNTIIKTWNVIKAITRVTGRVLIEAIHRLIINLFDTLFGFLNWPGKKLRIKIFILQDLQTGPVISPTELEAAVEYARRSFKKNFNTSLLSYRKQPL